jgi:hypothetical protein
MNPEFKMSSLKDKILDKDKVGVVVPAKKKIKEETKKYGKKK